MHQTKLIEFSNKTNDLLRGILLLNSNNVKVVLMCGGFERSTTTEKKFKILADKLIERDISSLRFDYTGCGLSDGDFSKITVEKMADDLRSAVEFLREEIEVEKISIVCHSLSACALGRVLNEENFKKIVLLAPALNQKNLLRYWFAMSAAKKDFPEAEINWNNFKDYLDENQFQKDCLRIDKMTKTGYISPSYFLENKDKDYSTYFKNN